MVNKLTNEQIKHLIEITRHSDLIVNILLGEGAPMKPAATRPIGVQPKVKPKEPQSSPALTAKGFANGVSHKKETGRFGA